jgi:KaiC/GvpD/RAD55 family RecA-like ATPase
MSESYEVSGLLPNDTLDELPAGTNIAIVGPSMTGKRELALELLAVRYEADEGILCITTDSAEQVYADLKRHIDPLNTDRIGIVDASGSGGQALVDISTESVSDPGDLTGISIGTAKLTQQLENRGTTDIRYGLISISTLLQYMDSQTVFRFLHVYTKRISETGGLGIYTLDSDSHDQQVVNTITGQFDGVIKLRESDTGEIEFQVRGFGRRPTPWEPMA